MKMRWLWGVFALGPLVALGGPVFKSIDSKGRITYSDVVPTDALQAEIVKVPSRANLVRSKSPAAHSPRPEDPYDLAPSTLQYEAEPAPEPSPSGSEPNSGVGDGATLSGGGTARGGQLSTGAQKPNADVRPPASSANGSLAARADPAVPSASVPSYGRFTAEPTSSPHSESGAYSIGTAAVESCDLSKPTITQPVARVDDFGAKGDGVTDDSAAITGAADSLVAGGTVLFTPGRVYRKASKIRIRRPGIKLWGYGATLYNVTTDNEIDRTSIASLTTVLEGPGSGMYGFTIISNLRSRLKGSGDTSAIYLAGDAQEAIDNRIEYGGGILVRGATNFLVSRNVIYRTPADGIHITQKSSTGRVTCNVVRETGDDMIAIVNYGPGEPTIGNFLVEGNDVAGQYWGRGIAVSGGRDVTIRRNRIANTTHGAAILITSEAQWKTASVRNVLIEDNNISDVQTMAPAYNPLGERVKTAQGGIDINGQRADGEVSDVLVRNNRIDGTYKDAIFVRNNVHSIGLEGNKISRAGRDAIDIAIQQSGEVGCSANVLEGAPISSPNCGMTVPTVRGADL